MKAISIKWPWSGLVALGLKDVENRTKGTEHRGPLLIHSGKSVDDIGSAGALWINGVLAERGEDAQLDVRDGELVLITSAGEFCHEPGCVIGIANLDDCVRDSDSPWAQEGQAHLCLSGARMIVPVSMRGHLGVYEVPTDALVALVDALRAAGITDTLPPEGALNLDPDELDKEDANLFDESMVDGHDVERLGCGDKCLPVPLTDEEIVAIAQSVAELHNELRSTEATKRDVMKNYSNKITALAEKLAAEVDKIKAGTEVRNVPCLEIKDYTAGRIYVVRADTGAIVSDRAMTNDDRQTRIHDGQEEHAPESSAFDEVVENVVGKVVDELNGMSPEEIQALDDLGDLEAGGEAETAEDAA